MGGSRAHKRPTRAGRFFRRLLGIALGSFSVSLILFGLFFWLMRTDTDRRLQAENARMAASYEGLRDREGRIADAIDYLQIRDNNIYRDLFYADAPSLEMFRTDDFLVSADTLPQGNLELYAAEKADQLLAATSRIEANFRAAARLIDARRDTLPPMHIPVPDARYTQIGASIGPRMSPFLKVELEHTGLDIIASQEAPVVAAADGVVSKANRSRKGEGNVVEIDHPGGYRTRYTHLGSIRVNKGQRVAAGDLIGTVGMSGTSFVPHLHYEVLRDSVRLDPVSCLFASVGPTAYMNMMFLSAHTGQSLE